MPPLSPSVDSDLSEAGNPAAAPLRNGQSVNIYCAPSTLGAMALLETSFKINR